MNVGKYGIHGASGNGKKKQWLLIDSMFDSIKWDNRLIMAINGINQVMVKKQ